MEKGLSSPSGAGAGLRMSETVVAGASMRSMPSVPRELLRGLGLEAVQVEVHVAGLDVERRTVDEEGVVEQAVGRRPGLVVGRLVGVVLGRRSPGRAPP